MSSRYSSLLSQKARFGILLLYIVGLFITSKVALDSWLPPTTERGLWFYSALAALLLGNLLVTPFFTKPVDAVSNAVAAVVALLAVNPWLSTRLIGFDRFTWSIALAYAALVLATAIGSIVLKGMASPSAQRMSESFFVLSDRLGGPQTVFSVVFLVALLTYHRGNAREYLTISIAWVVIVVFRPFEQVADICCRLRNIWSVGGKMTRLGEVVGHQVPSVILVREDRDQQASYGAIIVARSEEGRPGYAVALDHVGFSEGRWLRAIHACDAPERLVGATADGSVFHVPPGAVIDQLRLPIFEGRDHLLGLVAPDTTAGRMTIEFVRSDLPVRQGSLVEVQIGTRGVLYQVIDGVTCEEIVHQKNTRGYVRAKGKKVGTWNARQDCFDVVPWLPHPNAPVYLLADREFITERYAVGHFPGTRYPVRIDPAMLTTHNTAILGILGVGKTFLALELVERMIEMGIKVLCLDLTDQYAQQLGEFYDVDKEQKLLDELNMVGRNGKTKVSRNVEEGGSLSEFTARVSEHLRRFLAPDSAGPLKIYNPARFEVWKQDSKPFEHQASMATLTPCEITRIITERALGVLQEQGMTNKARCCLVYEEAHSLIPEWNAVASEGDKAATSGTAKAILQGRKFGLGCLVITQRTANVTKSILNQCNTVFALRVFDATGMEFLRNYIGEDYAGVLSNLEDRHAVVFGRASSCRDPVLIRLNDRDKFVEVFRQAAPKALMGEG